MYNSSFLLICKSPICSNMSSLPPPSIIPDVSIDKSIEHNLKADLLYKNISVNSHLIAS